LFPARYFQVSKWGLLFDEEVKLNLTANRSVCLGVGLTSGAEDHIIVFCLTIVDFLKWSALTEERADL
jgi:hypothetical protein